MAIIRLNQTLYYKMQSDIIKFEQQFEEIRGIIVMHRDRALRYVNEAFLQMSWILGTIVQLGTAQLPSILFLTTRNR